MDGLKDKREVALCVESLSYRYGSVDVFSEVNFSLAAGTITFLTGPNGAGKSTLFRCLAGWSAPRSGKMFMEGNPYDGTNRVQRSAIAYVPDVPTFYDDLTALEHIRFMQRANHCAPDENDADNLLDVLGLTRHCDQLPSSYSRGMRQKLAMVLALCMHPRLLLLDEPYGPLDRNASVTLSGLLEAARVEGAAILVSCHHDVPNLTPDQILHLEEGQLKVVDAANKADDAWSHSVPSVQN